MAEDEILDIFDSEGKPLGTASRRDVHQRGLWHRSFHCWILLLSTTGEKHIVFQRRGPFKKDWPSYLDISAAGHYVTGEGEEGGVRELAEELGIKVPPEQLQKQGIRTIDELLYNGTINREFQDIYFLRYQIDLSDYVLRYPEVAGVFHLRIADARDLLSERCDSILAEGVAINPEDGKMVRKQWVVTKQDFIPNALGYLRLVLKMADCFLDGDQKYSTLFGDRKLETVPLVLSNGSFWQPVKEEG